MDDLVGTGVAAGLAHPGGNLTALPLQMTEGIPNGNMQTGDFPGSSWIAASAGVAAAVEDSVARAAGTGQRTVVGGTRESHVTQPPRKASPRSRFSKSWAHS